MENIIKASIPSDQELSLEERNSIFSFFDKFRVLKIEIKKYEIKLLNE